MIFAASVEDNADCYQFVVFASDRAAAEQAAISAYRAEVEGDEDTTLEVGLTEIDPAKGYYFFG